MKQNWQQAGQKVKPGLKIAGKLVLLTALRYGPAGVAGWAIKSVARKPVRMLLAVALDYPCTDYFYISYVLSLQSCICNF